MAVAYPCEAAAYEDAPGRSEQSGRMHRSRRIVLAAALAAVVAGTLAPPAARGAGAGVAAEPTPKPRARPFGRGRARYHPTPLPPYRITDQRIAVWFDPPTGLVHGRTEIDAVDLTGAASLAFDSIGLQYETVTLDGAPATFRTDAGHLLVDVPDAADRTRTHTIVAQYNAHPQRGLYFIKPDAAYPDRAPEVWTQGETEDNRRWFPTWDEPNMKFPTTLAVRVPHDWIAVANGALVDDAVTSEGYRFPTPGASASASPGAPVFPADASRADRVFTWREAKPHSSYLTAFVAGPYVKVHDTLGTLPVDYYVHRGHEDEARTCFGRTPQMIDYFQRITGTPYPWEKYAQTTVQWFTAGGMENVSATTQTNFALHPAAYDLAQPCDGLVSHELAHQWFGDLVTTPDWPNIWINEGFATYFQERWTEHRWGRDQFDFERYHAQQSYFRETERYWRPVVDFDYGTAQDNFDASGYPRPAQMLHMLRTLLGDAAFRDAIAAYLAADGYTNVDTREFERQIERASGRDLRWFFDEWYYTPSHPHYVVAERYDAARRAEILDVRQQNHGGYLFRMPLVVAVETANGWVRTTPTVAAAARQTIVVPGVASPPRMVLFDEGNRVIRTLVDPKPVAMLARQARSAPLVGDRLWALDQLGRTAGAGRAAARAAVRSVATGDPFFGVRADAADAAAALDDAATLRAMLSDHDSRVRIAAARSVNALDHPRDPALAAALTALARTPDLEVRAAALAGLGATTAPGARPVLLTALATSSPLDLVARGALDGLGFLGDPATFAAIAARTAYGRPDQTRISAIAALSRFARRGPARARAEAALRGLLADPYFRVRSAAAQALGRTRDRRAVAWLEPLQGDSEESVQNTAYDAIDDLRHGRTGGAGRRTR